MAALIFILVCDHVKNSFILVADPQNMGLYTLFSYSPVPYVISFKFLGDLQNYTFLERLGLTEPDK